MSQFTDRQQLFHELMTHRGRTLLTLITSTKKPEHLFATQIAQDTLPLFYQILGEMGHQPKLDLLIYSQGGQIDTPWPLVNLLREYSDDLSVIVPWRAHSAATLLALGANTIEMGPLASLSPIDPQFQLTMPDKQKIAAGVEDVYGYYRLVKDTLSLDSNGRSEALKLLGSRITPEILGKVSRVRREIRVVANNLLGLHLPDDTAIKKIVDALVEELPSHQYMINRKEAYSLGLPVKKLDDKSEKLTFQILTSYMEEARMQEPGMSIDFGAEAVKIIELNRAFVETKERSFTFRSSYTFHRDGKVERKGDQWQEASR